MKTASHSIRIARIDDLEEIRRLETECFGATGVPEAQLRWLLENQGPDPSFHLRVAYETPVEGAGDRLIGFVCWKEKKDAQGLSFEILDLSVGKDYREEQVEHELIDEVVAAGTKAGALGIAVNVPQSNLPAAAFYLKQGFQLLHSVPGYYQDGSSVDVLVRRLR